MWHVGRGRIIFAKETTILERGFLIRSKRRESIAQFVGQLMHSYFLQLMNCPNGIQLPVGLLSVRVTCLRERNQTEFIIALNGR
jgi:hypothetical protein